MVNFGPGTSVAGPNPGADVSKTQLNGAALFAKPVALLVFAFGDFVTLFG